MAKIAELEAAEKEKMKVIKKFLAAFSCIFIKLIDIIIF